MAVDHYENFPVASLLLPTRLRHPVALIYRFAREADDFADEGEDAPDVRLARLDAFRQDLNRLERGAPPETVWFPELGRLIHDYRLPFALFHDLLSAFSQDVVKTRYANRDELLDYCRRSANPVGRLLLVLYGAREPAHRAQSDAICSSLQLINFLQDVAIDYRKNRVYLPQDEMARFGVNDEQIARQDTGGRWRELMAFQVDRARAMMNEGAPLGRALGGRIGLELRMIVAGGSRILEKIENVGGNVFEYRPVLRPLDWPLMFLRAVR